MFNEKAGQMLQSLTLAERNCIKVFREYTFTDWRRIDILVVVEDKLVVGIEHKVNSHESEKQTEDYATSVQNTFPTCVHVLLYLTPKGDSPVSKDFKAISYSQLVNSLKKVQFDYRDDIRRKVFFDEFLLHMEEHFMNKQPVGISDQTKLYLEYRDTIVVLLRHFREDSLKVFKEFEDIVTNLFIGEEWNYNIKQGREWHQIFKKSWISRGLFIHHEFWICSENILFKDVMHHLIEVEGKAKDDFLTLFDNEYNKIEDQYSYYGIQYRPDKRKKAIAYRELENYFNISYTNNNMLAEEIRKCSLLRQP